MANEARSVRRRNERAAAKERKRGGTGERRVPTGEFGVEVDCQDDGVLFTMLAGKTVVSCKWTHEDARQIAKMIDAAGNRDEKRAVEVVRESGIVVPPPGMQL